MKHADLQTLLTKPAVAKRNQHLLASASSGAEPEPTVCHEPMAAAQRETGHTGRISVCITSFRKRLLDPDNLCPKYFIDCLRYAGLIPNDRQQDIDLHVSQIKVQQGAHTEIIVERL